MERIKNALIGFWKDEEGPTAVEYAVMVTLIAVAILAGAGILGTNTNDRFDSTATSIGG